MTKSRLQELLPILALLLAMVLWASSFIALKIAFVEYDPVVVIFGRMLVATLCFLLVGRRLARSLDYHTGDYRLILFMAFCEPCLYFIFEAKAVENTTASQAGMITAMLPVLVMVAASLILKEKVSWRGWLGALVAVTGVCWLTLESSPSSDAPNPVLGNFLEFMAMVCATGYTIALKRLTSRYSPFLLTAIQALMGSFFYFPLLFLPGTVMPNAFHLSSALAIVYLGAVITLGAYGLYNYAVAYVPASRATLYVNLIPVYTVILSWMILGETFSLTQCAAALVIIGGVYISQTKNKT